MKNHGGTIESVAQGSSGAKLGLRPGDRVVTINGRPIRDVLDYQFYSCEDELEINFRRQDEEIVVRCPASGSLGIEFAEPTFDGVRRCNNHCLFCFVEQLPGGLRQSLFVKDDDLRYSFLYGNFLTLTNLTEDDWRRLAEQRIAPLHVSVHATETALRRHLLGNPAAPDVMAQLRRLAEIGISFHAQVVLCPGINDGAALDRTVGDLVTLHPQLLSIGIVPAAVGERGAARVPGLRGFAPGEAAPVIRQIEAQQRVLRKQFGASVVYLADEFYLMAGQPFPPARNYDGFVQYENGIGMARTLVDEWGRIKRKAKTPPAPHSGRFAVVTGRLFSPVLQQLLNEMQEVFGLSFDLIPVVNRLFGEHVTVAGLLGGAEVIDSLREAAVEVPVFLPSSMLDASGLRTLDGLSKAEFEARLGVPVRFVSTIGDVISECKLREVNACVA